jgi:hypothetical protein
MQNGLANAFPRRLSGKRLLVVALLGKSIPEGMN